MTDTKNPYATPNTDVTGANQGLQKRSSIPKVVGIISIIFAILGLVGSVMSLAASFFMPAVLEAQTNMGFSEGYILGSAILGLLMSLWALFIGIKLIKYKDSGRKQFNIYAIINVLMSIGTYFYMQSAMKSMFSGMDPAAAAAAQEMSSITSLSAFIGPILIIIVALLLNKKSSKESLTN